MTKRVHILELRSVRGTGGGPEKTILLGAQRSDPRVAVTVCYIRDTSDAAFGVAERAGVLGSEYVEVAERGSFDPRIWGALRRIVRERDNGTAVIIVSAELDEVVALADRVAGMYAGRIVGIVPADTSRAVLGLMMAGMSAEEAEQAARTEAGHLPAPGEIDPGEPGPRGPSLSKGDA